MNPGDLEASEIATDQLIDILLSDGRFSTDELIDTVFDAIIDVWHVDHISDIGDS